MSGVDDNLNQLEHMKGQYYYDEDDVQRFTAVARERVNSVNQTSVNPMCGFLMRFCRQLLSVRVNSRLVDLRSMSSISVELEHEKQ